MTTALRLRNGVITKQYTVASTDTATKGEAVLLDSDTTVDDCNAASDLAIGVAMSSQTADEEVEVALFGYGVVPVKVGASGATRGKKAQLEASGFTDATSHDSDGTSNESTYGIFLQSGTSGHFVGLLLSGAANRGV